MARITVTFMLARRRHTLDQVRRPLKRRIPALLVCAALAAPIAMPYLAAQAPSSAKPVAAEREPASANQPENPTDKMILVVGASGTAEYRAQFTRDAQRWMRLARDRHIDLVVIDEDEKAEQSGHREQLQAAIASAEKEAAAPLWIILIGHGTSERGLHKFNLVGPDVSSKELAQWLKEFVGRDVIVINCASASAPFLPELSGPRRIVVTATRSGSENNYSRFGTQLADCVLDPATDIDHDEEVSLLEAFLAAAAKTEKFYREQDRLATEHALIDDNGDKLGTGAEFFRGTRAVKAAQAGKQLDGEKAAKLILFSAPDAPKLSQNAQDERAQIEAQINQLRANKPSPATDVYWAELEQLLLKLAELYASAEQ